MELSLLLPVVEKIHGCTFASLDALTEPKPGVMHRITGQRVLLFRTNGGSGYEGMIKRKLVEAGKNPDLFHVGPLPWGERLDNLPIIVHNGGHYLQTIELSPGKSSYFLKLTNAEIDPAVFGIRIKLQPPDEKPRMHTYNIESLERLTLMGETLAVVADKPKRAIISIKTE